MDVEIVPTRAISYANSEIYVRFEESVRGSRRLRAAEPLRRRSTSGSWSS